MRKKDDIEQQLKQLIEKEVERQVQDVLVKPYVRMLEQYMDEHRQVMKDVRDCLKVISQSKVKVRKSMLSEAN
jgi:hypothetical protein